MYTLELLENQRRYCQKFLQIIVKIYVEKDYWLLINDSKLLINITIISIENEFRLNANTCTFI